MTELELMLHSVHANNLEIKMRFMICLLFYCLA